MRKKNLIIFLAICVFVVVAGVYIYNKESKMKKALNNTQEELGETGDPFANIVFPTGIDEATREVMQKNIDGTKKMYAESPNIWETWIAIGSMRQMLENYHGAISAYRQSIILQSNNVLGYRNMAEIYKNNLNDYEKAQEYYKLAIENNTIDSELYVSLALVQQFKLNNPAAAENTLLNGLNRAIDKRDILLRLINFYKSTSQPDKQKETEKLLANMEQKDGGILNTIGVQ